jgi:hypothetical protein
MFWIISSALIGFWLFGQFASTPVAGYVNGALALGISFVLMRLVESRGTFRVAGPAERNA